MAVLLALAAQAQTGRAVDVRAPRVTEGQPAWRGCWWASVAILGAANFADLHSSRGLAERNPLLRDPQGRFDYSRGALVKFSATGALTLVEWLLIKKRPEARLEKPFTLINVSAAAAAAATAARNHMIP